MFVKWILLMKNAFGIFVFVYFLSLESWFVPFHLLILIISYWISALASDTVFHSMTFIIKSQFGIFIYVYFPLLELCFVVLILVISYCITECLLWILNFFLWSWFCCLIFVVFANFYAKCECFCSIYVFFLVEIELVLILWQFDVGFVMGFIVVWSRFGMYINVECCMVFVPV